VRGRAGCRRSTRSRHPPTWRSRCRRPRTSCRRRRSCRRPRARRSWRSSRRARPRPGLVGCLEPASVGELHRRERSDGRGRRVDSEHGEAVDVERAAARAVEAAGRGAAASGPRWAPIRRRSDPTPACAAAARPRRSCW
jgi:hypothetical protein